MWLNADQNTEKCVMQEFTLIFNLNYFAQYCLSSLVPIILYLNGVFLILKKLANVECK